MTIAACHLSPEGVVLGADSATTISGGIRGDCHLDYAQKVFEVGPCGSSLGLVTWGLGQIGGDSHRTIAACLGAQHASKPFMTMHDVAQALANDLQARFGAAHAAEIQLFQDLETKVKAGTASPQEVDDYAILFQAGSGGYCIAGRVAGHGACQAFQILWGLNLPVPTITELTQEAPWFWGVPQIMQRLLFGVDSQIIADIMQTNKWQGSPQELIDVALRNQLIFPRLLPIREAVDWVHTVIHTTIRGTKFAKWPHWCGGPVEIAAITTDRPFRWVRHKSLDAAIITAEEAGQ